MIGLTEEERLFLLKTLKEFQYELTWHLPDHSGNTRRRELCIQVLNKLREL